MARSGWLENKGGWQFEMHTLLRLSGPINAVIADINGDGRPDIVALVSQEWEEIWAFVNDGRGTLHAADDLGLDQSGFRIELADAGRSGSRRRPRHPATATATRSTTRRRTAGRGTACSGSRTRGNLQFDVSPHRRPARRLEPAGGGYRRRRRSRRRRRQRVQRLGQPGGAQPRLARKQRPDAVHEAHHRGLAHAPDHACGGRSRRQRHDRTSSPAACTSTGRSRGCGE